jgi:hypothetical protein
MSSTDEVFGKGKSDFHLIARISRHPTPYAWAWLPVSWHAIFPYRAFALWLAIRSRDNPPISARCAGYITARLMAHRLLRALRRPSDVIMMQGDGKGIAMRPEHRTGKSDAAHPGIKKMAEIVAVADFTPAPREPEDIAAPPARRQAHPGPKARDKWVSASVTEDIPAMIGKAFDEADRRDPQRVRQRVFLVDGNKQQITAISGHAGKRGLKVPILIDFIHVAGYLGKAAAALHPGDPGAAGQWADGQKLRVLHGRAKAVAATLASVAAKTRANPRTRHLDLADMDRAVTYLANNRAYMGYGKALEKGWPIATGMIEGACRFVIEDRFGITGARWSPEGAEDILKLRAVVVHGDLDDYMRYSRHATGKNTT